MPHNPIRGFLDFDNTLMETEKYALPSLIARFNTLYQDQTPSPLTLEIFKKHFHGQARETLCINLGSFFNISVDYSLLYQDRELKIAEHLRALPEGITMAPNLIAALKTLASHGVIFSLVTNNPIVRALVSMECANNHQGDTLKGFFGDRLFEAGKLQKPLPDVYLRAIQDTHANPVQSFAVEDSVTGATASIAAGLKTFAFTGFAENPNDLSKKLIEKGCVAAFNDWREFPALLLTHMPTLDTGASIHPCCELSPLRSL